jgi:hypothetical protein
MSALRSRARFGALVAAVLVVAGATTAGALFTDTVTTSGSLATGSLAAPTGLVATGKSVVNLSWTASASGFAGGTSVLRGTASGGPYSPVASIGDPSTTTYHDDSVSPGTTYYYAVQAYFHSWTSPLSNQASLAVVASQLEQLATAYAGNSSATSTTVTFPDVPALGDLLVVVAATRQDSAITLAGWTKATGTARGSQLQQAIFYKASAGVADKSVTVSHDSSVGAIGLQAYDFTGVAALPLGAAGSSSGSGTTLSSGNILAAPLTLVFAAVVSSAGTTNDDTSWTGGFSGTSFQTGGGANAATFGSAWRTVNTLGTYATTVIGGMSASWKGEIVAFGPVS